MVMFLEDPDDMDYFMKKAQNVGIAGVGNSAKTWAWVSVWLPVAEGAPLDPSYYGVLVVDHFPRNKRVFSPPPTSRSLQVSGSFRQHEEWQFQQSQEKTVMGEAWASYALSKPLSGTHTHMDVSHRANFELSCPSWINPGLGYDAGLSVGLASLRVRRAKLEGVNLSFIDALARGTADFVGTKFWGRSGVLIMCNGDRPMEWRYVSSI